jgi:hypothetical protein
MHRSGTSLVSELLSGLGVDMGAEGGLWEDRRFVEVNRSILSDAGGDWAHLPDHGAIVDAAYDHISKIEALVAERQDGAECWGWKDPRNSLTLSAYLPFLPALRLVFVKRRKEDIVASLMNRHQKGELAVWPPTRWAHLTDEYWRRCSAYLNRLGGVPKAVIRYEELVDERRSHRAFERLKWVLKQ